MARTKMSEDEKLARRAVRDYLAALESNRPKPGRKRTPDSIANRLDRIEAEIASASPLKRLELAQEKLDLADELRNLETIVDTDALEAGFVANAKRYGESKGLSHAAWRAVGVSADLLKQADISRGA